MIQKAIKVLLVLFFLSSCGALDTTNSFSTDEARFTRVTGGCTSSNSARAILQNNCVVCHEHAWMGTASEQEFISLYQVIVAGNPASSLIYTKLKGAGYGGNMPSNGGQLSSEQISTIRSWIVELGAGCGSS